MAHRIHSHSPDRTTATSATAVASILIEKDGNQPKSWALCLPESVPVPRKARAVLSERQNR